MASLGQTFKATDHDTEQRDYEELPNGIYRLEIEASDVGPTKDGRGTILKTTNVVIEPEQFKGRKLFNVYNLQNPNSEAQRIGQQQLASLCRAMGIETVDESEDLHFHTYVATIKLGKPSKDGRYSARAEIARYWFPDQGNVPEPAVDANQPVARSSPANDNRPAAANSNKPAPTAAAAGGQKKRPWG